MSAVNGSGGGGGSIMDYFWGSSNEVEEEVVDGTIEHDPNCVDPSCAHPNNGALLQEGDDGVERQQHDCADNCLVHSIAREQAEYTSFWQRMTGGYCGEVAMRDDTTQQQTIDDTDNVAQNFTSEAEEMRYASPVKGLDRSSSSPWVPTIGGDEG